MDKDHDQLLEKRLILIAKAIESPKKRTRNYNKNFTSPFAQHSCLHILSGKKILDWK